MLISFSPGTASCYPISIWFRNRSPLREASYKTGSMNIACISSQQNSAGLTGSHGFALFCAAEYRGVMNKLMSQPVPTSGTPVTEWFYVLMTGMWTCSISEAYFHGESGSEMLLRKMAGESSAAPYIPYSGQYRHTISQLRLIPDAHPVPMKWVWPPDSSDTFRSCSNFWL